MCIIDLLVYSSLSYILFYAEVQLICAAKFDLLKISMNDVSRMQVPFILNRIEKMRESHKLVEKIDIINSRNYLLEGEQNLIREVLNMLVPKCLRRTNYLCEISLHNLENHIDLRESAGVHRSQNRLNLHHIFMIE
jgi:hypothetical protein